MYILTKRLRAPIRQQIPERSFVALIRPSRIHVITFWRPLSLLPAESVLHTGQRAQPVIPAPAPGTFHVAENDDYRYHVPSRYPALYECVWYHFSLEPSSQELQRSAALLSKPWSYHRRLPFSFTPIMLALVYIALTGFNLPKPLVPYEPL